MFPQQNNIWIIISSFNLHLSAANKSTQTKSTVLVTFLFLELKTLKINSRKTLNLEN